MVDTVTAFREKNEMNLDVYHFSGKFHAVKMNQTVFRGGFIQLVWGDEYCFDPLYDIQCHQSNATIQTHFCGKQKSLKTKSIIMS